MNRKRLAKIARELRQMRRNPFDIKPSELERIAGKLGRRKVKRGSEPNYASPTVPDLGHPLSIPHHQILKPGTARSIIDALLSDADSWEQYLDLLGSGDDESDGAEVEEDEVNASDDDQSDDTIQSTE